MVVVAQLLGRVQLFCGLMDCNLPGSSVNGILQARIQEWVAISFSRGLEPAFTGGFFTTEPPGNPHCSPLGFSNLFLSCLGQTPRHVGGGGGGGVGERETESGGVWT